MDPGRIRLISCYELGHAPLAVASAKAFLERAGFHPQTLDLALESLETIVSGEDDDGSMLVAISVPMHTALHVGVRAARRIRERDPATHICLYGLYATLNAAELLEEGVCDSTIGGEFEAPLVDLARALAEGRQLAGVAGLHLAGRPAAANLERLSFPVPSRAGLPAADRYARLVLDGEERPAAAVEASRGCLHHCRHCPIPAVYGGRFFVVPHEIVLRDVDNLVASGVRHLTFADPDFFNGPGHTMALVRKLHERHAELTFDLTTKIENLLRHREKLPGLADQGCVFIVSAVESLNEEVLRQLVKGHTGEDVFEAARLVAEAGITLRPSLVPFTPWETRRSYGELLDWIDREGLVEQIDPIQLSIRLLVPPGSLLERSEAMRPHLRGSAPQGFTWRWTHPDPAMDELQKSIAEIVKQAALDDERPHRTYARIYQTADGSEGATPTRFLPARATAPPPRLTEPWFC